MTAALLPIVMPLAAALTAVIVGAFAGAALLLPLQELGSVSDRAGGNSFEWATQINYWPRDALIQRRASSA